ncbi:putative diacylglycerol acyltransferase, serine aminopeptidase, S33, alpha/Beta hydrolase [Helianthus annuus]|nr:putative diacylglycerol acyltransferase, serine aminopeptidase, S33, alpha/Beta hydrolase [Helianthus annuus]
MVQHVLLSSYYYQYNEIYIKHYYLYSYSTLLYYFKYNRSSIMFTLPPPPPYLLPTANRASFTATFSPRNSVTGLRPHRVSKHQRIQASALQDYFQQSKYLLTKSDGGPPRWLSPLECASCFHNSPLLLTLPGIDGNGHALLMHYQRLGQIFDIWCLHIPTTDRTPFTDLVKLVETTIRSESHRFPNRPIYIMGESMGACLALAVAAHAPDINLVLVLANPATSFSKSQLQALVPVLKAIPDQLCVSFPYLLSIMTGVPSRMMKATVEKGLPFQQTAIDLSEDVAAWLSYMSGLADVETILWKLKMVESACEYSNSHIRNVSAQTLVLLSGKDQLFPNLVEGQRLCRILPKCQMRIFNDCGHAMFLDEDIDLVAVIKEAGFYHRAELLPPSPLEIRKCVDSLRWTDVAASPVLLSTLETGKIVRGLDGIPAEGPVLFVGHHNILGFEMIPMLRHFIIERNINVRTLAHPIALNMFKQVKVPELARYNFLRIMGAVPVTASNMYQLFSMKSHVLLYPGGVREGLHRKGEEYKLFWPKQPEFIRLAATFGAKIVPFGAVGEDDFTQLVFDYDDQMKIPFLKAYIDMLTNQSVNLRTDAEDEFANQDMHVPGLLAKVPGRYYFLFGKPIETQGRKHELRKRDKAEEAYLQVKCEVEKCLAYLLKRREEDPYRNIITRLMYQATHGGLDSHVPTFHID